MKQVKQEQKGKEEQKKAFVEGLKWVREDK
jgi:hypothetical protein